MKSFFVKCLCGGMVPALFCFFLFGSCQSLASPFTGLRSWSWSGEEGEKAALRLLGVSVEMTGGRNLLEQEINGMIPLIFGEWGYGFPAGTGQADYVLDVRVREREYIQNWQTRRSLSLELRLWRDRGTGSALYQDTPLAAARSLYTGSQSFSSSRQLDRMLRAAVKELTNRLENGGGRAAGDGRVQG